MAIGYCRVAGRLLKCAQASLQTPGISRRFGAGAGCVNNRARVLFLLRFKHGLILPGKRPRQKTRSSRSVKSTGRFSTVP